MAYLMDFEYLMKTEKETESISFNEDPAWLRQYKECVNVFFKVVYFVGKEEDANSLDGMFLAFAHNHYLKIPYTLRSIIILLTKGYYAESALLVRNLFETLVQLRYFHTYKDKLHNHVIELKRIKIKQMVDEFGEDLYSTVYKALSVIAHAEFGSSVFRTNYKSPKNGKIIMGSIYNKQFYYFITNPLSAITYGLINFISIFFRHYNTLVPEEIENFRQNSLKKVENIIFSDPKSEIFLKDISKLIGLNR